MEHKTINVMDNTIVRNDIIFNNLWHIIEIEIAFSSLKLILTTAFCTAIFAVNHFDLLGTFQIVVIEITQIAITTFMDMEHHRHTQWYFRIFSEIFKHIGNIVESIISRNKCCIKSVSAGEH